MQGIEDVAPDPSLNELDLLIAAEARIDTALSHLILTTKGVTDATHAQSVAITELREARKTTKSLRDWVGRQG